MLEKAEIRLHTVNEGGVIDKGQKGMSVDDGLWECCHFRGEAVRERHRVWQSWSARQESAVHGVKNRRIGNSLTGFQSLVSKTCCVLHFGCQSETWSVRICGNKN